MRTRSKILLTAAAVLIAAGLLINTGIIREPRLHVLYVLLPVGAICFGLFLTSRLLDHESAEYDKETAISRAAADSKQPVRKR